MLPTFAIIGAEKSATTFIQHCLKEHPDIFMPSEEISYFEDPYFHQTNTRQFEMLFDGAKSKRATGIKRPNYLHKIECPHRIKRALPDVKLIVILRNPVERAVSAYFHNINYGFIPCEPAERGMRKLLDGKYDILRFPRSQEIIEFSFYYKHLTRYFALFDKEQILVLFHEDIIERKLEQIKKIYRFLEVDHSYIPQTINTRPQAVIYSINRLRFLRLRNNFIFTYNNERTLVFVKEKKSLDKMISRVIHAVDRFILARYFGSKKPVLSDQLRKRLYLLYEQDIENLEILLDKKLTHWKYTGKY